MYAYLFYSKSCKEAMDYYLSIDNRISLLKWNNMYGALATIRIYSPLIINIMQWNLLYCRQIFSSICLRYAYYKEFDLCMKNVSSIPSISVLESYGASHYSPWNWHVQVKSRTRKTFFCTNGLLIGENFVHISQHP